MEQCVKSELDLFQKKPIQFSIIDSVTVGYKPVSSSPNSNSIEFVIPKSSDKYYDLSSIFLKLHVKLNGPFSVTKDSQGVVTSTERAACINNLLHSIFSQLHVSLNGINITRNADNYAYRAYIETLLNYGPEAAKSHLSSSLFYLDSDSFLADDKNTGFVSREKALKNTVELYGRIHADLFNSSLLLGMGSEMKIRLVRSSDSFVLLSSFAKSSITFEIKDATLYVKNLTPAPSILLSHARTLAMGANFKYHISRADIKTVVIPSNEYSANLSNIILGSLPNLIIISFVKNNAYSGTPNSNPFFFEHFNYDNLSLNVSGVQVPSEAYTPKWAEGRFQRAYQSLFNELHIKHSNNSHMVTPEFFKNGGHLLAFDLTPDSSGVESHGSLPRTGNISLNIRFEKALSDSITVIIYSLYDNVIEIDAAGNVLLDY